MASMGKGVGAAELSTGLADFTISVSRFLQYDDSQMLTCLSFLVQTVKYMDRLPDVQSAAGSALLSLGDGNWKMGEGVQVGKGSKVTEGDEQTILEHYICTLQFNFLGQQLHDA